MFDFVFLLVSVVGGGGHAVAQLVVALRYKPERRGFESRWCHWNFLLTLSFRSHYGPGVDLVNRNEYQEYFLGSKGGRCVGLTTLRPSCEDCLEIWEPQPPGALRGLSRLVMGFLFCVCGDSNVTYAGCCVSKATECTKGTKTHKFNGTHHASNVK
jgi:hypothetical protein